LVARTRGWRPGGSFTLGVWGWPINIVALLYGLAAIVNMSWPRSPDDPWFSNYGIIVTSLAVVGLGLVYLVTAKPYDKGRAPAGDAHRIAASVGEPISD
jgi:hypothetical protein